MKSHTYAFTVADVFRATLAPLALLPLLAGFLHFGKGLLPAPRPALDVDRTIIVHQAEAARSPQNATVLLVGDSSCLMDVSARQLAAGLQQPVLNLGTLSYL